MSTGRNVLLAALLISAGALCAPGRSAAAVLVDVDVAPPAPRVEVVPAARPGFIWAPGYWAWRGHEHVWIRGRWIRERAGLHWVPDAWVAAGPRWHYVPGHWER